jgi:sortase A
VIQSIELDAPIVPVGWQTIEQGGQSHSVWEVADNAVGWHRTSAYPGQGDNLVLNGHHNIRGEVFRDLVEVEIGDRVILHVGEQTYVYAIVEKHILKEKGQPLQVRQENAQWIGATQDERLTMVTCWPYTDNTHRLVVVGKPASTPEVHGLEP